MRTILVEADKTFRITIPDDAKITFGPWSPPRAGNDGSDRWNNTDGNKRGTLRIYQGTKENIIAVFSQVVSFRDLSVGYSVQVAKEEGATIWKDDEHGYMREHKQTVSKEWVQDPALLPPPKKDKAKKNRN